LTDAPADQTQPRAPSSPPHRPVMLAEVLQTLAPADGEVFIDGTFGAGGYTTAILDAANTRVIALDRDPRAIRAAAPLLARFGPRLTLVEAPFSTLDEIAHEYADSLSQSPEALAQGDCDPRAGSVGRPRASKKVDGVVLDIGVSSMQLDQPERGFSFQNDGPLDMRMSAHGQTAADVVNTYDEEPLANILYDLGEEKKSRHIANAIVKQRATTPFTTTLELARLVSRVLGGRKDGDRHPATRTFQALRIYVNDELGELERALDAAERILKPDGRLVVVTFHSLEDRIVKRFFIERSGRESQGSRHLPPTAEKNAQPSFRIVNQRPLSPCQPELDLNPRARSARLRSGIRTTA